MANLPLIDLFGQKHINNETQSLHIDRVLCVKLRDDYDSLSASFSNRGHSLVAYIVGESIERDHLK